jgi:hypothetical protein
VKKLVLATLALAGLVSASTATFANPVNCVSQRIGNQTYTRCN